MISVISTIKIIYVSTKLNVRHFDNLLPRPADDIIWYGECYRALTPSYLTWLHSRYTQARKRNLDGIIPDDQFKHLRARYWRLFLWVLYHWRWGNREYPVLFNYQPPRIAPDGLPESLDRKGLKWYG